ncbi:MULTISPECIES: GIY-YIG nuclease family protein [unclassified Sphingobium]|uniref:GIY-YIG nuclease family protein n=1 Tax=unclassified Sphingobium TaxID=2611147 RepID=UPI002224DC16|nr:MULTISPECIES: GIY-YIG nuclease family protein [unclassified Sphingobium]MCW2410303.1 putative endonuclease [Sphingobium sp. B8D3D]MCW2414005.1 putative endonuclease [Sphingobium sp. B8D3A]
MTCAGYVYIMAGRRNGTIYTGVTSDLVRRVTQHRTGEIKGFTTKYGCKLLVWYEAHDDLQNARQRELRIKEWKRQWKLRLIEEINPDWNDLFESICQNWTPAFAGEQGSEASP